MARHAFIGVDNVARKCNRILLGVDNVARNAQYAYIGINNVARKFFGDGHKWIFTTEAVGEYVTLYDASAGINSDGYLEMHVHADNTVGNFNGAYAHCYLYDDFNAGDVITLTWTSNFTDSSTRELNKKLVCMDDDGNALHDLSSGGLILPGTETDGSYTLTIPEGTTRLRLTLRHGYN